MSDIEALTEVLYADAELGPGYVMRDDCEHLARRLLASDWLREHDAEVRRATGEQIARAVEASYASRPTAAADAVRIAREVTR